MREYQPRRQSSRWLDGDCPRGVLAIYDNGGDRNKRSGSLDRYMVFYADTGSFGGHGQMRAHEAAAYRYRFAHQACRWTDLPRRGRLV